MKKIPIGISDFKELIEENFYYIDKTLFIDELKKTSGKVLLIPRPRRFGKTLNLSMLKYFYEKSDQAHDYLFYSTAIWQHKNYHAMQGQYPVIFLTFKGVKSSDFATAYDQIISVIIQEFRRHADYLLPNLDEYDAHDYKKILSGSASKTSYSNSLFFLTRLLRKHYKKRVIVLLDEYDAPIHAAYHHGYYEQLIEFVRSLFVAVFKDNSYLERGILTGILRAAKEGIFSGLNNLRIFTVLDDKFSDKFGFVQDEADQFLRDYKLTKKAQDIKDWYNGYHCGKTQSLYNPWSFIECVDNKGELMPYWSNTSDNLLIKKLIARADETVKSELEDFLSGSTVVKEVQDAIIIPGIEDDSLALWGLLLFAGYATFDKIQLKDGKKWCTLVIPNKEIKLLLHDLIQTIFKQSLTTRKIQNLHQALSSGNEEQFAELLQEFVINSMSVFDIPSQEPEKSYHLFVLGLLVLMSDYYQVKSNRESGYGRYDIMLIPHNKKELGIVIEFKKVSRLKPEDIEIVAQKALDQIVEKKYAQELRALGVKKITAYGIAFAGKQLCIKAVEL